jgi:hypothetical protein
MYYQCFVLSKSRRNLLNFKDISYNSYHIKTNNESSEEYLYITSMVSSQKLILEKLSISLLSYIIEQLKQML